MLPVLVAQVENHCTTQALVFQIWCLKFLNLPKLIYFILLYFLFEYNILDPVILRLALFFSFGFENTHLFFSIPPPPFFFTFLRWLASVHYETDQRWLWIRVCIKHLFIYLSPIFFQKELRQIKTMLIRPQSYWQPRSDFFSPLLGMGHPGPNYLLTTQETTLPKARIVVRMVRQFQTLVSFTDTFQYTLFRGPGFTTLSASVCLLPALEQLQCIYCQLRKKSIFIRMWKMLNFLTIDKLVCKEKAYRNSLQYAIMCDINIWSLPSTYARSKWTMFLQHE